MIRAVHDFAFADVALDPSANAARDASVEDVVSLEHVDHLREDGVKRVDRRVLETPMATLRPAPHAVDRGAPSVPPVGPALDTMPRRAPRWNATL